MRRLPFRFALLACAAAFFVIGPARAQDGYVPNPAITHMETRLSAVEDQMRALTGKVEQVDFLLRRMDQVLQKMQADYEDRLHKLETAPPPPAPVVSPPAPPPAEESTGADAEAETAEPPPPSEPVEGTLGGVKMRDGKVTGAVVNPKSPPLPKKPADYGLTAQEHYDKAFGLLRQANYEEAEKVFKTFIDKYGTDKLIDNAKYWYAETFYVRGKYSDAAVGFAEAYQQNPKGTKAPDSLLKLAMALAGLEKKADACSTLEALKAKHPAAPASLRARADQERVRLKCK